METAPEATLADCCRCRLHAATLPSYLIKVALSQLCVLHQGKKGTELYRLRRALKFNQQKMEYLAPIMSLMAASQQ